MRERLRGAHRSRLARAGRRAHGRRRDGGRRADRRGRAAYCDPSATKCCHNNAGAGGTCELKATTCQVGFVAVECDGPEECGGGANVRCELRTNMNNLQSIRCESAAANCTPTGMQTAFIVCNPSGSACVTGTCTNTGWGYWHCQ
jgi:hypothetical protein